MQIDSRILDIEEFASLSKAYIEIKSKLPRFIEHKPVIGNNDDAIQLTVNKILNIGYSVSMMVVTQDFDEFIVANQLAEHKDLIKKSLICVLFELKSKETDLENIDYYLKLRIIATLIRNENLFESGKKRYIDLTDLFVAMMAFNKVIEAL